MTGLELHQGAVEKGVIVLQPVRLINYQARPANVPQQVLLLEEDLVGGQNGVELDLRVRVRPLGLINLDIYSGRGNKGREGAWRGGRGHKGRGHKGKGHNKEGKEER